MGLMATCTSCGREIRWSVVAKSGKKMPLDRAQVADGNIVALATVDGASGLPLVEYVGLDTDVELARYRSHFASCPHAAAHRTAKR